MSQKGGKEVETVEVTKYANVTVNKKKIRTLQDPLDVAGIEITGAIVGQPPQQGDPNPIHYISGMFLMEILQSRILMGL